MTPSDSKSNERPANSSPTNDSRCHHQYANGTRCRLTSPSADTRFCQRHAKLPQNQSEAGDVATALTADLDEFNSPSDVSEFLSRLLLAFAQDRISPRRAAVLGYIASQLLRSLNAAERQAQDQAQKAQPPVQFIWDIPRPAYEHPVSPTP